MSLFSLPETRQPILLTGVYRSGTSILHQIVNAHPQVSLVYDAIKFLRFVVDRFAPIEENWEQALEETHLRLTQRWQMPFDLDNAKVELFSLPKVEAQDLYYAIMKAVDPELKSNTKVRWGEKNAMVWTKVPDFLRLFPEGQVIHIIRDPRDVVASYKKMTNEIGKTYLDGAFNCLHAMNAIQAYSQCYSEKQFRFIRLEDLVSNPEDQARELCKFLDLPESNAMIQYENYRDKQGKTWQHNSAFTGSSAGIFSETNRRSNLTDEELFLVELIAGQKMLEFGYEPSGNLPSISQCKSAFDCLEDDYLREGFDLFMKTGNGREQYRTNPIATELQAVGVELL
jgi:hypothetical protein